MRMCVHHSDTRTCYCVPQLLSTVLHHYCRKLMRDAALACLDKIVCNKDGSTNAATFEAFLAPLAPAMNNTVGRAELLQWAHT
jgi:hypothetical protein